MNITKLQQLEIKKFTLRENVEIVTITGFGTSYGVSVDKSKNIYIPSFNSGLIYKISAKIENSEILNIIEDKLVKIDNSRPLFSLKGSLKQPHDIDFDEEENMYITEMGPGWGKCAGQVTKVSPSGKVIDRIGYDANNGKGLDGPTVSHCGKDGYLYVSEWRAHKILRYDSNNRITGWLGKYNINEQKINSYNFSTQDENNISSYLFFPHAIRIGPDENLYVADTENHRVVKFDNNGKYIGWIGKRNDGSFNNNWSNDGFSIKGPELGAFNNPIDLEFVKDNFYVADNGNHRIIKINLSGNAISWIGENINKSNCMTWNKEGLSVKSDSLIGLNQPFGLRIKDRKIYIADRGNKRIKVIKSNLIN